MGTSQSKLELIVNARDNASGVLARIGGGLSSLGGIATSVAIGGLAAVAGGLAAIGTVGLSFNSQIEQVTARLNAFTKDGAETARILEQIKAEAAKTPFEFQEMANATANLMSSAKQANIPLMDLIKTSEILAASNPAQGLEGAAFSLKEALSGDFVSIVERFNLPRQRLKELKEEGVPAMEAISIAMREMGLDSSLVSNMAETAAGRWSTLKDTFVNLAGTVTQPIFDTFSAGLGNANKWLEDNKVTMQQWAETGRQSIQAVIDIITPLASGETAKALFNFQASLSRIGVTEEQIQGITDLLTGNLFGKEMMTPGGMVETGGLLRAIGLSDEEVAKTKESIDNVVRDADRISVAFSKIFEAGSGEGAEGGGALVSTLRTIDFLANSAAFGLEKVVAAKAILEGIGANAEVIAEKGSIFGQSAGPNFNSEVAAPKFLGTPGASPNAPLIDVSALTQAITSAIQSIPIQIDLTANMDGQTIASLVSGRLGAQAQSLARQGGFNPR